MNESSQDCEICRLSADVLVLMNGVSHTLCDKCAALANMLGANITRAVQIRQNQIASLVESPDDSS